MSQKLYVGNLPFTATEEEIRALFAKHGTVLSVKLISDRDTGRPRGFGFVEMEDATAAMSALDGYDFGGRALRVNEAQERQERRPGGDRDRSSGGGRGGGGGGGGWRR
jgi:RNA recognition motif-containing protein